MEEAFISILCGHKPWEFHTNPGLWGGIIFNQDGTGEIWAAGELGFGEVFSLRHSWKKLSPVHITSTHTTTVDSRRPEILGSLDVEITLVRRLAKSSPTLKYAYGYTDTDEELDSIVFHPKSLLDAAFEPRIFTITMERGNFSHQDDYDWRCSYLYQRWGFRIVFDTSPYPARETWNQAESGCERLECFAQRRVAVAKVLPGSAKHVRPMEDDTWMGSIIGDSRARAGKGIGNSCNVS